jgi:site-specific recombinase XerD
VLDSLTSEHSRRAYGVALDDLLTWWNRQGRPSMSKAMVQRYKRKLQNDDLAPSTINQRLSAIRKLAQEAADDGLVDPHLAAGIAQVKGVRSGGRRFGNWPTREQAQELLNAPDTTTLKGLRDRAILAVLLGAGLCRSEAAELTFEHVQQREGRWVLADIVGKRNKVRSVPLPSWVKLAIDEWAGAAGISGERDTFFASWLSRPILSHSDDSLLYATSTGRSLRSRYRIYIPLDSVKKAPANVIHVGTSCQRTKPHVT